MSDATRGPDWDTIPLRQRRSAAHVAIEALWEARYRLDEWRHRQSMPAQSASNLEAAYKALIHHLESLT